MRQCIIISLRGHKSENALFIAFKATCYILAFIYLFFLLKIVIKMLVLSDLHECRAALKSFLKSTAPVCFFTGAGISTESGIPDFRSPGGIWSQYRIVEYGEFLDSEDARLEDWDRRFHMAEIFEQAEPNAAHRLIAHMVGDGRAVGLITQNIDGLHQRAARGAGLDGKLDGTIVEFHGTGAYAHCLSCSKHFQIADMRSFVENKGQAPRCSCGGLIKAAVVSFGENVPKAYLDRAVLLVDSAKSMVAIGSSLQVWPASGLLERALGRGVPLCIINREMTPFDQKADLILRGNAAEISESIDFS